MKILIVGNGGRAHAIARKLASEGHEVHAAPGNPGIGALATLHHVDPLNGEEVADLASMSEVDLVVIGPEGPLVAGVADVVRAAGIPTFGPSQDAARLEGSKAFSKEVMDAAGVPTARSFVCTTPEQAAAALDAFGAPYVVKDDALAAGKGVVVTSDRDTALAHAAGCERVVIEEYLDGPEVSLFVICDGETMYPLQAAQDFKRVFDNDEGPNTGGMGSYSPLTWAPADLVDEVVTSVVGPTLAEMRRRGTPFSGLLFVGLALTTRGPRVIEFNVRFGDPETQSVLALLTSDLAPLLFGAATGTLRSVVPPAFSAGCACTVVMAACGYPESSSQGVVRSGLVGAVPGAYVIHAGTARGRGGEIVTAGGRVLSVVALGDDLATARERAYQVVHAISFDGAQFRTDIALSACRYEIAVPYAGGRCGHLY